MSADDLARRFLHVNVNTVDADAAQRFFVDCLGLRLQMRTDPGFPVDGEILGLSGKVRCDTRFFYDSRGPRASCAIEVIEWLDPTTAPSNVSSVGLVSMGFLVTDRASTVETISSHGFSIIAADAVGPITGGPVAWSSAPTASASKSVTYPADQASGCASPGFASSVPTSNDPWRSTPESGSAGPMESKG